MQESLLMRLAALVLAVWNRNNVNNKGAADVLKVAEAFEKYLKEGGQ